MQGTGSSLDDYRMEIDRIDRELVDLLVQRMEVSASIGRYKMEHGLEVLDRSREQVKLDQVASLAGPDMAHYMRELYESIMAVSRQRQEDLLG